MSLTDTKTIIQHKLRWIRDNGPTANTETKIIPLPFYSYTIDMAGRHKWIAMSVEAKKKTQINEFVDISIVFCTLHNIKLFCDAFVIYLSWFCVSGKPTLKIVRGKNTFFRLGTNSPKTKKQTLWMRAYYFSKEFNFLRKINLHIKFKWWPRWVRVKRARV